MSIIKKWLNESSVNRFKDDLGNTYGIRVLGRGENLFFQENNKGLICEIDAVDSVIYSASIKNWDGEKIMSPKEKNRVIDLIKHYYKKVYSPDVTVI